ncbi:MAG: ABC transporter permease, partial [Novosphingobium sp. 17-62-8]
MGDLSEGARLQAMATVPGAETRATPVELKAVDAKWPLYGRFTLADGQSVGPPQGLSAWIAPGVADRLDVKTGDRIQVGKAVLSVGGIIGSEPDRLAEGFSLGPTIIISKAALDASALVQPGSMVRTKLRVKLPASADPVALGESIKAKYPLAGYEVRTLATLKILGASSGDIARIFLLQLAAASSLAILAGLAVGISVTPLLGKALQGLLPIKPGLVIDARALAIAAAYGALISLTFAAPPLVRARDFPAMALMRARVNPLASQWRAVLLPVGLGLAGIAALAILTAPQPLLAAGFLGGAALLFVLLTLLGKGLTALAARIPRPKGAIARMALANLHRPGAQTSALVVALGFGLASFVLLAGVQTSLDGNIVSRVPTRAPDYFVLDVPRDRMVAFDAVVKGAAPAADIRTVAALRGSIVAYGPPNAMTRVADLKQIPDNAWPLRGDRGLTYSDALPEGN